MTHTHPLSHTLSLSLSYIHTHTHTHARTHARANIHTFISGRLETVGKVRSKREKVRKVAVTWRKTKLEHVAHNHSYLVHTPNGNVQKRHGYLTGRRVSTEK